MTEELVGLFDFFTRSIEGEVAVMWPRSTKNHTRTHRIGETVIKRLGDGWLMAPYIGPPPQQKIILQIAAEVAGLTLGRHIVVDFRSR